MNFLVHRAELELEEGRCVIPERMREFTDDLYRCPFLRRPSPPLPLSFWPLAHVRPFPSSSFHVFFFPFFRDDFASVSVNRPLSWVNAFKQVQPFYKGML